MQLARVNRYVARAREAGLAANLRIVLARLSGYLRYGSDAFNRIRMRSAPPPSFDAQTDRTSGDVIPAFCVLWGEVALQGLRAIMAPGAKGEAFGCAAIERADALLAADLSLLGWGKIPCSMPPPWHSDVYRGTTWPLDFHKRVDILRSAVHCDVKVPWELSRLQFLTWLGQAWIASANPSYMLAFWNILRNWSTNNPVGYGVNWTCSMEVAIRAINIAVAANLFGATLTRAEVAWLKKLLSDHYNHIRFNLELSDVNGNHYFFNMLGLATLGAILFGPQARGVRKQVLRFVDETARQFHADGVHIENATGYHRLVTEGLVFFLGFCRRNSISLPASYEGIVAAASNFLRVIHVGDGSIPLIGDSDSGNVLILGNARGNQVRPLLQLCGIVLGGSDVSGPELLHEETAWFLATPEVLVSDHKNKPVGEQRAIPSVTTNSYADGGYYVIRDAESMIIVRCGSSGLRGRGSHDHNDQLSVYVSVFGQPLFIDPGTHNYTADLVAHARDLATERHSTVTVNSLEQSPVRIGSVTSVVRSARANCTSFSRTEDGRCNLEGTIEEYDGPESGLSHTRRLELLQLSAHSLAVTIADTVNSKLSDSLNCVATLAIHPSWQVDVVNDQIVRLRGAVGTVDISVAGVAANIHIVRDKMSPEYGAVAPMDLLRISFSGHGIAGLKTMINCRRAAVEQDDQTGPMWTSVP